MLKANQEKNKFLKGLHDRKSFKKKAVKHLKLAIKNNSNHLPSTLALCELHNREGEFQKCENIIRNTIKQGINSCELFFELGKALFEQKKYKEALKLIDKAILIKPEDQRLYKLGSGILHADNKKDLAIPYLEKLIDLNPLDGNAYFELSKLLSATEDFSRKKLILEISLDLIPDFENALLELAILHLNQSNSEEINEEKRTLHVNEAQNLFLRIIQNNPSFGESFYQIAKINFKEKNYKIAEKYFNQASKYKDTIGKSYYYLAMINLDKKKIIKAKSFFLKSIENNSHKSYSFFHIAMIQLNESKYTISIITLDNALEEIVLEEKYFYDKSDFYLKSSNFQLARKFLKKAMEFKKLNSKILVKKYQIKKLVEKSYNDEHLLITATKLDPSNEESYYEMGLLFKEKNMFEEAEKSFLKSCNCVWNNSKPHLELGKLYVMLNDLEKSLTHLKIVLDLDNNNIEALQILKNYKIC